MHSSNDYSWLDRLIHRLAFELRPLQRVLIELEDDLYKTQIKAARRGGEVFVTGLPRSGTTLLLNLLYETGEFTTFTYRQMPFLQIPLLWQKISSPFQRAGVKKERAHGDSVAVSFDSPEAFEEAIWLDYLREKIVTEKYLNPITAQDCSKEFVQNFKKTIAKLIALSGLPPGEQPRYLSKNNVNISRLTALPKLFPDSIIFVPFREPAAHVSSLIHQHNRFMERHLEDRFSKKYMEWLGHFEFGGNLKPVNYSGWLTERSFDPSNLTPDFWLDYWIQAYTHVERNLSSKVFLIDYERFLDDGTGLLSKISDCAAISQSHQLEKSVDVLRKPTTSPTPIMDFDPVLWEKAEALYHALRGRSL